MIAHKLIKKEKEDMKKKKRKKKMKEFHKLKIVGMQMLPLTQGDIIQIIILLKEDILVHI